MADHVIGERRREPRRPPGAHGDAQPVIPGARILEVIDVSRHGLRCRLAQPVRPGRPMGVRVPGTGGHGLVKAHVVRCEVWRLTRQGVQYDAAWVLDRPWTPE